MDREALEFQISQYADGTLPAGDVAALEARLADDAEAREMLAEYRRLDAHLARHLPPMPNVNWDRLAAHLSTAVAAEADAVPVVAGRIGPASASTWTWRSRFAIAASVAIVLGTGALLFKARQSSPGLMPPSNAAPQSVA